MNRTRRGFLATLALLPGLGLLGRRRVPIDCSSCALLQHPDNPPDPFKFRLGQRLRRKDDGQEGIVIERSEGLVGDWSTATTRRNYSLATDEDIHYLGLSGFGGPEDTFEAVPALSGKGGVVMDVNEIPIAEIDH